MTSAFGFNCPSGGQWYTCGERTSRFVGCCTSDPCSNGCVQGDIRPGGYNASAHGTFPDASCGVASNFWTCGAGSTFWGCCKTNACANTPAATCNTTDLVPAFLERPEQFKAYLPGESDSGGSSNGAVIGGAVGGAVGALILIGIFVFFFLRRRRRRRQAVSPESGANASTPMMKERPEDRLSSQYGGQSPPPTYSSPNPNMYQSMDPTKGPHYNHHSYQEYGHHSNGPQELPAESSSPVENRYSELPAGASSSHRISELPAGAGHASAELESPQVSPAPLQTEFSTDLAKRPDRLSGSIPEERPREKN